MSQASATVADEQFAARELVRSWAAGSDAIKAARDVEQGDRQAWRAPYGSLSQLGIFGVALPTTKCSLAQTLVAGSLLPSPE